MNVKFKNLTKILHIETISALGDLTVRKTLLASSAIAIACVSAFAAVNVARERGTLDGKRVELVRPCGDQEFDLKLSVKPVGAVDANTVPRSLSLRLKGGKGTIERGANEETLTAVNTLSCERWQAKYWSLVDKMVLESGWAKRARMECLNIGEIRYKAGSKNKVAKLCLGDTRADGVTWAFRELYDGTDALIAR